MSTSNTKRKLKPEVIAEVFEREGGCCARCGRSNELDKPHHAWHGIDANYEKNRNDADQLILLCRYCHRSIHDEGNQDLREWCKDYLTQYYEET